MPEYDDFAETYQRWTESAVPYRVIELYSFFNVLGSVAGLRILDLAAGDGRVSRMMIEAGAASVVGADVSPEMERRAEEQATVEGAGGSLSFMVLDATDPDFRLDPPADVVAAMYLFHYAPSESDLQRMAALIARNLVPGGRFVTYTLSPDYDFHRRDPVLEERCGFHYAVVDKNHCQVIIGEERVDIWQWSREAHETALHRAGLTDIRWHPLKTPPDRPELRTTMQFYIDNPSCLVLSATKPR
jgi:SAM-dependent methyltransferase